MSAGAAQGAISDATRELMTQWERVRESWRDQKSDEFARKHLAGLGEDATRAVQVVAELERIFAKIHGDCE